MRELAAYLIYPIIMVYWLYVALVVVVAIVTAATRARKSVAPRVRIWLVHATVALVVVSIPPILVYFSW
jgi:hypothetical protein